jgi:hypothetical protein
MGDAGRPLVSAPTADGRKGSKENNALPPPLPGNRGGQGGDKRLIYIAIYDYDPVEEGDLELQKVSLIDCT